MAADAPSLARLHHAARAAAMPGLREAHGIDDVARWIATVLMVRHAVRVAEDGGRPVGYIGYGQDDQHGPMVLHLYLDPAWLRRGIGSRLLAEAMAALGPRLSLFCIARNAGARAFYEAHGFRAAATSDGAGTEEGEPDILFVRDAVASVITRKQAGATP
jgi:RimJ/RimL family protein N-acetyltransferase